MVISNDKLSQRNYRKKCFQKLTEEELQTIKDERLAQKLTNQVGGHTKRCKTFSTNRKTLFPLMKTMFRVSITFPLYLNNNQTDY